MARTCADDFVQLVVVSSDEEVAEEPFADDKPTVPVAKKQLTLSISHGPPPKKAKKLSVASSSKEAISASNVKSDPNSVLKFFQGGHV